MNECLYLLEAVFLIRVHWTDNYLSLIGAMSLKAPFINSNSLYNNPLRPLLKWFSRYLLISIGGCGKPNAYMLAACVAHMLVDWVAYMSVDWVAYMSVDWVAHTLVEWVAHMLAACVAHMLAACVAHVLAACVAHMSVDWVAYILAACVAHMLVDWVGHMSAACVAHMLVDWVLLLILIWYLFIVRYVIWIPIYLLSWRKHSFFLFPNLTEDCGFFESFVPLYEYKNLSLENAKKSKKGKGGECRQPDNKEFFLLVSTY